MDTLADYNKLADQCAAIPITTPGFVQAVGALIVLEKPSYNIIAVSKNISDLISSIDETCLQTSASEKVPELLALCEGLSETGHSTHEWQGKQVRFVHNADSLVIELRAAPTDLQTLQKQIGTEFYRLVRADNLNQLHEAALLGLHQLIGFDHIMVYRFDEAWNGEVVAEWIHPDEKQHYSEYLNLNFPERDVPAQARALYEKYWVRYTADVNQDPVPLIANAAQPLDIGGAYVRGIAPSHVKYLQNMGVAATYSASIIVNGKLWGLLAAHHIDAKPLSFEALDATEEFAKLYSALVALKIQDQTSKWLERHQSLLNRYSDAISQGQDPLKMDERQLQALAESFDAHGAVAFEEKITSSWGEVADNQACMTILKIANEKSTSSILHSNHLQSLDNNLEGKNCAGVLFIGAPAAANRGVLLFRKAEPQEKHWGGDPRLEATVIKDGQLNPRNSFDVWKETLSGYSRNWQEEELALAEAISERMTMAHVTLGTMESAQKTAKLNMLNMLLHDIGNALAGVSGEVLQLQQGLEDRSALTNLEKLLTFIKDQSQSLNNAIGEPKTQALHNLIEQVHKTLEQQFDSTQESTQHMETGLTHARELLDLQKIYAQSSTNYGRECYLAEVLNDAYSVLRSSVENRGKLHISIDDNVPALTIDRSKIMQVVMNLIKNAFEAWDARLEKINDVKEGDMKIDLVVTSDGENVTLKVHDNGIGLDQEQQDIIFQQAYSTKQRSSGIGLMNCKRLAESSGASLSLSSQGRGQGATAVLVFPKELWV